MRNGIRFDLQLRNGPGSSLRAYSVAVLLVIISSLLRWGMGFVVDLSSPFTTYYPAVLFATVFGGLGAGTFAAILGGVIGWWAFMPPYFEFAFETTGQKIDVLIYFIASLFVVWGAEHYRGLIKRLQDEENLRKLAVEELAHRLKNKIATIQSVLSYQLREQPRLRDDIIARLIALSATDDLIMATQERGASIRNILSTELGAYEMSRIAMEGPDVFLSPKLAMTMALLVHELATNAAKYGSLSNPVGKLSIYWSLSAATLSLEWRESGGPIVASPTNRGFGLRLLSRALDQFGGAVEMAFERTGLICKMKARYPESSPSIAPEPSRIGA